MPEFSRSDLITYDIPLRPDLFIRLTLPVLLAKDEAERLCGIIRTLPFAAIEDPGDRACAKCGTANIVWFTPDNDLWNRVEQATGSDVLCVTCFVRVAEDVLGVVPPAWMVSPEPRPETDGRWVWQPSAPAEEGS